ncbi:GAF domain-containing protein [Halorubrum sp. DTA98]|uniref:GAF domain-containing protein n=1 Tax=Halorubrum sp. DTA98 TaxID=3402163 RepID=UPI003AAE012E
MTGSIRVLYVAADDRAATRLAAANDRIDVTTAESMRTGVETLDTAAVDCVVSDRDLPDGTGIELLDAVRDEHGDLPFVLFLRTDSERVAVEAMRHGATDYVANDDTEAAYDDLAARIIDAVERRRESPFERLPVGAIVWNDSTEIVRVNEAAESILEQDGTRLRGATWTELVPDDEPAAVRETMDRLREGESQTTLVSETLTEGGETVSCEWHHRAVTNASGGLRSVLSAFQDVSDRVERERRVSQLRDQLRELAFATTKAEATRIAVDAAEKVMEARLSGIHLLDESGETIGPTVLTGTALEAFETVPKYERDAAYGTRDAFIWDVFESGTPRRVDDVAGDDRIREDTPAGSIIVHPLDDHGVFIVSALETDAFTDADDALTEILARTLTTALDRVERDERRYERERRLARLHEATRDLIASETEAEVATKAIEAAGDILGFSISVVRLYDEDVGGLVPVAESEAVDDVLPPRKAFVPGDGSLNWRTYERGEIAVYDDIEREHGAFDSGTGLRSLMILPIGEYGTLSVGELEPNAFDDSDVSMARILATTVETVLEANERKAALRRQRDELEAQNTRLERFADVLSHDLRNPLTVAQGRLQLARESSDSPHHAAIGRAHDRIETLIDDLLTLARNGEAVDDPEPIELRRLVTQCWNTVETDAAELRVLTDATIEADPNRLRQLIENLIRNSVEHGSTSNRAEPDDSVEHGSTGNRPEVGDSVEHGSTSDRETSGDDPSDELTITVGALPNDAGFYVEDDGPGIPEDLRSKVFEFGYTTTQGGTGFGLSIVASIAEAHGWTVELTESDAGGARFEFRTS